MRVPSRPSLLFAVLIFAAIFTAGSTLRAYAQTLPVYKAGDVVGVDPQLNHLWSEGTITSVTVYGGKVYGYVVRVNSGPAGAGKSLRLSPAHFRPGTQAVVANGPFRVGDMVEADFFGTGHWVKGRIAGVYPAQGPVSQYTVEDASVVGARGAEAQLAPGSVRPLVGAQLIQPAPPELRTPPIQPATLAGPAGQFKPGDRVLTSINSASGDYQPCTIMGPLSQGVYPVRCDPYKGSQYSDWGAFPQFIKPWPGATPAPRVQACSFSVPGGTVTRNSPPTAQTFQRVIYNMAAIAKDGPWGMTFTRFDIGTPIRNSVISNGTGGVELAHPKAPQGASIYPITSEYVRCITLDASYDERTLVDVNFICMKNNDGDWDCPTYSTAEVTKRERVPR